MNHFLTEHGLEPFDLPAADLVDMLLNNIKPGEEGYHTRARTRTAHTNREAYNIYVMKQLVNAVEHMIEKPCCIFKHPDLPIATAREMVNYKKGKNEAAFNIGDLEMFDILYDMGQLSVITSFTGEKNPVTDYSIQLVLVSQPIFMSWERNLIIDNVLKELV